MSLIVTLFTAITTDEKRPAPAAVAVCVSGQSGLSWRHLATLGLLLCTVPVFLVGAAMALPVMLLTSIGAALR